MPLLHAHEVELQELARQATPQEYRLPYGETDGRPVEQLEYETPSELLNLVKLAVRVSGMDAGAINIITADQQQVVEVLDLQDDVDIRGLLVQILTREGFEVTETGADDYIASPSTGRPEASVVTSTTGTAHRRAFT